MRSEMEKKETIHTIVTFLREIGLRVMIESHEEPSFLPGIKIKNGGLSLDLSKLHYPGDILHEAGHLAVFPLSSRADFDGVLPDTNEHKGGELASLAWSYAACLHLGFAANVVFHEDGYKGESAWLIETFGAGSYIGLPMLQYRGMTYDEKKAKEFGVKPFPEMQHWLCPQ